MRELGRSGMGTVEEPGTRRNFCWSDVFPCCQEKRRWLRGLHLSEGGRWKSIKQPGEMRAPTPSSQSSVTRCHLSPLYWLPSLSQAVGFTKLALLGGAAGRGGSSGRRFIRGPAGSSAFTTQHLFN